MTRIVVQPSFRRKRQLLERELRSARLDTARELKAAVRAATPVRTGRLRAGWVIQTTQRGFAIVNRVPYAVFVNARQMLVAANLNRQKVVQSYREAVRQRLRRVR